MNPRSWSTEFEGAVAIVLVTSALLIYGALYENVMALRGATVPAVALVIALVLALVDMLIRSAGLRQSMEDPLPVSSIFLGTFACTAFAFGLVYVGLVVSSALALFISVSILRRRLQLLVMVTSIGTSLFIWVIFTYLGRTFMGDPWLF